MKNSATGYIKKERGITIIVLIITIVIMLILLGVSTKVVIDGKIVNTAQKAVNETNNRTDKTQTETNELLGELDEVIQSQCQHEWGEWENIKDVTSSETGKRKRTCKKCGKVAEQDILIIGSYITGYDPSIGENGQTITTQYTSEGAKNGATDQTFAVTSIPLWKVIGQDEAGHIIIMSDDPVQTVDNTGLKITGEVGYLNAINELNKVSSIYGQGKYADKTLYPVGNSTNKGSGARSIKVEDFKYTIKDWTYEIKTDEEDGKEYIYINETKWKENGATYKVRYYDETSKEWKTLALGDAPVTFNEIEVGFTGEQRNFLRSNKDGTDVRCWFATKHSKVYYFWIAGSCIYGLSRGGPVPLSILDSYDAQKTQNVQPIVFLKDNINLQYDATTKTYTILGYK